MWCYSYFALHNDSATARWTVISQELFDAQQLLKTAGPAASAVAAHAAISRFEHATGTTPGAGPEVLYTRAEAERAAYAAFDRLRLHISLDQRNDREFVAQAFLAFLDNPDSPYPYASHNPEDEDEDGEGGGGLGSTG
ncbi:hypothetical protein ACH419_31280 [Streptomyces bobili]|uniref:hypothetical protein n=1 Tax=Streptomyces bobili TaxID=67280 RepID=UPI00379E1375